MLGVEGKDKVQEGWGARRMDKGGCEPWFFRTGRGTSGIPARVRRCSVRAKVGSVVPKVLPERVPVPPLLVLIAAQSSGRGRW